MKFKSETNLIVLQMQGDQAWKRKDKDGAYRFYLAAAMLADDLKKQETAKCIRDKMTFLFGNDD